VEDSSGSGQSLFHDQPLEASFLKPALLGSWFLFLLPDVFHRCLSVEETGTSKAGGEVCDRRKRINQIKLAKARTVPIGNASIEADGATHVRRVRRAAHRRLGESSRIVFKKKSENERENIYVYRVDFPEGRLNFVLQINKESNLVDTFFPPISIQD
jgi:hypothetical protein